MPDSPTPSPADIVAAFMERLPRYVPTPQPAQALFCSLPHFEAMYGGAAFGGKTFGLLIAASLYVDVPRYSARLFRRTYPELSASGGLIDLSKEWFTGHARYNESRHEWRFPSGAKVGFSSIQHEKDIEALERGPSHQYLGWDELTTFTEPMYRRLFSRLRRPSKGPLSKVPLRARSGTNPGGEGHEWVRARFVQPRCPERPFIAARWRDNPAGDFDSYSKSLDILDPVAAARMRDGDWEIREGGEFFDRAWFTAEGRLLREAPVCVQRVRFWDCAATVSNTAAWTAGCLMGRTAEGYFVILSMERFRARPGDRDARIRATAESDGRDVPVRIEEEGGSAGKHQAEDQVRMLAGWDAATVRPHGEKAERAAPLARQAQAGNVRLVSSGSWVGTFLDEVQGFPGGRWKDQVDAASGAFLHLTQFGPISAVSSVERARPKQREDLEEAETEALGPTWGGRPVGGARGGRLFR